MFDTIAYSPNGIPFALLSAVGDGIDKVADISGSSDGMMQPSLTLVVTLPCVQVHLGNAASSLAPSVGDAAGTPLPHCKLQPYQGADLDAANSIEGFARISVE